MNFVSWHSTYTQSVQKFVSKHELWQVKNFVYLRSTCLLTVRNMSSRSDLHQLKVDLYWRSTLRLSLLIMAWKHDYIQVKKLMYSRATYSLSVRNMFSKHDLRQLKKFVYFALDIQSICAQYALETCLAQSDEISGDRQLVYHFRLCVQHKTCFNTWNSGICTRPTDNPCLFSNMSCAKWRYSSICLRYPAWVKYEIQK